MKEINSQSSVEKNDKKEYEKPEIKEHKPLEESTAYIYYYYA